MSGVRMCRESAGNGAIDWTARCAMTVRTLADIDDALTTAHATEVEYRNLGETGLASQWNRQVDRLLDERRQAMGLVPAGSAV